MSEVDELVDRFMLITNIKDRDVAVNILNITNWDLEEAVLYHIDSQEMSKMEETTDQKKKNGMLGKEEVVEHARNADRKNCSRSKKNGKAQKNDEGGVRESKKRKEKELGEKRRHKEKKSERSSKEERSPITSVGEDNSEEMESEEKIENTNKENEKIKRETTFLGILKPVVSLISPFFRNFGNFISVILNFLGAFLLSAYTENDFNSHYERKYGAFHVSFFKGSFKKAVLEAKKSSKLLVIYCHLELERNHFCEHIFTDPKAKDFIDANFIVFADSATCAKAPVIKMMMTKISFPALLVAIPLEDTNVKVLKYVNGHPSVPQVIDMLTACIEHMYLMEETLGREQNVSRGVSQNGNINLGTNHAHLHSMNNVGSSGLGNYFPNIMTDHKINSNITANTELGKVGGKVGQTAYSNESRNGLVKRNVGNTGTGINVRTNRNTHVTYRTEDVERNIRDRLIREEQDREYQEALLMDQMKEEKRKEEQRLKRLKSDVKKDIKEERKIKSKNFSLKINEGEQITKICSRFPNGKRIQRNFSVEHTVKNIYEWVEYSEFLEKDITVPYKFELICGHSKKVLEKNEKRIKDFDLIPNAILNVKSLDTSDEE